jgi:glycine oxidase
MKEDEIDYLIVGQGLAGSAVALQLIKKRKKILVIDQPHSNTSSRIAAGLFNPLTGRYLKKTWMANSIFTCLPEFYREAEKSTHTSFFHPMPLYRPFFSVEEQNEWMGKSTDPVFSDYVNKIYIDKTHKYINDPFGGLMINHCGYLDTGKYVNAVRTLLENEGSFLEQVFNQNLLEVFPSHVKYKNILAKKIILCEGEKVTNCKWFSWLPVIPLKGETLTIRISEKMEKIVNRGVYIVPATGNELRIGSTYNWDDLTPQPTPEGKRELVEKLEELVNFPYEIIDHNWGMRPTTRDRRPFIGAHPEHPSVTVFNGLGTKGVSLAPYLSKIFIAWLEDNTDLNKEVNVNRYKYLYSKFTN